MWSLTQAGGVIKEEGEEKNFNGIEQQKLFCYKFLTSYTLIVNDTHTHELTEYVVVYYCNDLFTFYFCIETNLFLLPTLHTQSSHHHAQTHTIHFKPFGISIFFVCFNFLHKLLFVHTEFMKIK